MDAEKECMRSVQVSKVNGTFEVVERDTLPEPGEGQVLIFCATNESAIRRLSRLLEEVKHSHQ
jgi:hypothetical protein